MLPPPLPPLPHEVLPPVLSPEQGAPPPPPQDFQDGYTLPVHCLKPLQRMLPPHPLDGDLVFHEKEHIYEFKGVPTTGSVTALAHQFQPHFVPKAAIASMRNSKKEKWPRVKYAVDVRKVENREADLVPARGCMAVVDGKTLGIVHPHSMRSSATPDDIFRMLMLSIQGGSEELTSDTELYTFERGMTDEEIERKWNSDGTLASNKGTEGHYMCELFLNGLPCRWWEGEMSVLFDFLRRYVVPRGIVSHSTEKEIVCEDADIGGSIDALLWDEEAKVVHILDFKRSDKLIGDMHNLYRRKMDQPMTHLDDCRGASYALQLSIYQYILERDYGMRIGDRILLSIHPDAPFCTSVPYLRAEADFIFRQRFALVRARRQVAREVPELRCTLTGAPAVDAVRLTTGSNAGRLAMERAAPLRGSDSAVAEEERRRFEAAVDEFKEHVPPPETAECIPWRKRIGASGELPF